MKMIRLLIGTLVAAVHVAGVLVILIWRSNMARKFREVIANSYIFVCFIGLIITVMFLAHSVAIQQNRIDELEFKVKYLQQRDDTLTQQLQEMNRYIGYPGG
ncbi:hypothetical protein MU448_00440 [Streptococcus sp. O1]|nr:hypothetical protein [Streptococcus sp. O1]